MESVGFESLSGTFDIHNLLWLVQVSIIKCVKHSCSPVITLLVEMKLKQSRITIGSSSHQVNVGKLSTIGLGGALRSHECQSILEGQLHLECCNPQFISLD